MQIVTVNVGAASPGVSGPAVAEGMRQWALGAAAVRPSVVFAQETSEPWLDVWRNAGYQVHTAEPRYRPVSAVIVDGSWRESSSVILPTQAYHGSYMAACRVPWQDSDAVLVSAHASPNVADPVYEKRWPASVERPLPRNGGGSYRPGTLFDADYVLATLADVVRAHICLAAGDFNEARGWDLSPGHESETWGSAFFDAVRAAGLVDPVNALWREERPTRRVASGPVLQLDHVVASPDVAGLVVNAHLGSRWQDAAEDNLSDHAPIWVTLRDVD